MRHIISVLLENEPGALSRVVGLFSARDLGRFQLYATRRGPYVALRRKDGLPVVVTPDDPEHFRAMLARRLGGRRSDVG